MRSFGQLADRWAPQIDDPEQRSRIRFFVQGWLIAWPMALLWTVISVFQGVWLQVLFNAVLVALGPLSIWGMRRTRSLAPWFQIGMGAALLLYGPGLLCQTPVDETSMFIASVIPLLAGFVLGGWSALRWTVLTCLTCVGSLALAAHGYSLSPHDDLPLLTKSLNIATALALAGLFAARFHQVRGEALANSESASRSRSLFLASVSHEIRTPMNGVLGMTEVMLLEATDPAVREQLEVIHRSGSLMVDLINDLLDLTKLEARRITLENVDFDLAAVLGDVERLFLPRAKEKGLRFAVALAPDLGLHRKGDALRLRQVLFNLVSNGLKFTEHGAVTLTVSRKEGPLVDFCVQDTGIGIPAQTLPRLFAMFEQADASTTRRFGGTGLGLALARPLVAMMGGQLQVDSTEGVGSRFHFCVPLAPGAPLLVTAPRAAVLEPDAPWVLVVDDNAINLKVAVSLLRKAGYQAHAVASGAEAVAAASSTSYLAVLMDCHMPGMDGFEATRRIHALPAPFGRVPVLALTASTSGEDLAACRQSGMREVLIKPISIKALVASLTPLQAGEAALRS